LAPEQLSNRYILDNVVRDSYVDKQGNKHANSKAQNHINMDEDELHEQLNRLSIEEEDAIVIDNTHLLEALDRPSLESSDYGHSRSNTVSADTQHTRATSRTQSNSTPASHQHPTAASTQPTAQTRSPREDGGADTPTQSRIVKIVCGHSHSIAITEFGDVFTWGKGSYGRLGHGSHCDEFVPRRVAALSSGSVYYRITSAAAGMAHTLFLTDTGILYGCGLNASGQLGVVTTTSKPQMGDNDIAESSGAGNEVDVCANGDGVSLKLRRILNVPELTTSVDRCTLL
jgi:alpha-tubulin suppressor-like RCC1 family protein